MALELKAGELGEGKWVGEMGRRGKGRKAVEVGGRDEDRTGMALSWKLS